MSLKGMEKSTMMKRLFNLLLVLGIGLVLVGAALLGAHASRAATQPPDAFLQVDEPESPPPTSPDWGGAWTFGPNTTFQFTRFDGEYYPNDGLVYFMGGRLADNNTDGSVWVFNPVAGVYTDTGVDLPTPISNYQINLLQDANGWGMYIFCGRPAPGGGINFVQVYYPDTNTAVQLPAGDDYPGTGTCSFGLNAVYQNKVYLAGGFDGVSNNFNETWVFDPMAPTGSRWTNITSASLSQARAFIMSAVVNDLIYAIGGNYWDGTGQVSVTTVEVLDPNSATPVWDDAIVADLTEPCSESRAWGFELDSPYVDPDATSLAGKVIVACGTWEDENNHVLVYDTQLDFWENFPYLQGDRRDEAGAFIPQTAEGASNGIPGLWVWGGRRDADTNVLISSEFYEVISGTIYFSLLPAGQSGGAPAGSTAYYTMTILNSLGYTESFDMAYSSGWPISGPSTVGPIGDGQTQDFLVSVDVPDEDCYVTDTATLTAVSQSGLFTNTATIESSVTPSGVGGVTGTVIDANTSLGIPNAYVFMQFGDGSQYYYDTFANDFGDYTIPDVISGCTYDLSASAQGYEFVYPAGYSTTVQANTNVTADVTLNAPEMSWSQDSFDVTLDAGERVTFTLWITNSGTSDLSFGLDSSSPLPTSPVGNLALPFGDAKVDPKLRTAMTEAANGRADILVIMAEQADLNSAYAIQDWSVRGQYVYNTLKETADRTQAGVRDLLTGRQETYRVFYALNGLLVYNGDTALLDLLAARADVGFLTINGSVQLEKPQFSLTAYGPPAAANAVEWNIARVNADDVWATYNITGTGIVVANIDTGVDWIHDALVSQYRGGPGNHDYNWYMPLTPSICGDGSEPCDDPWGHGTHTMGTMVGDDGGTNQIGVAPGAEWIACKACEFNSCSFEALLACGDWMVAPTDTSGNNPVPNMRPNIVNNSWAYEGGDFWYAPVVSAWRASGIFPQFAGGNAGPSCSTTGSPGDYWLSFSAAAVDIFDDAADFSSRGPALFTGITKPNISAPGVDVLSSIPGNLYDLGSGTSMASPHVAGVVALLWSADPELVGDIEATMSLLSQTAEPMFTADTCGGNNGTDHPNNTFGWGMVDAFAAVTEALAGNQTVPWLELFPAGGVIPPGSSMEVKVVFQAPDVTGTYTGTLHLTANEPYNPDVQMPLSMTVEIPGPSSFEIYLPLVGRNE
jgi:subtilisin family serine protease